ncbi:hypothetical protein [Spiroplasma phoeniceum]|uniref:Uncharacterized protein n=1 Tax=Spiroplasma phoeniceum P40 TaxID=1276259 RepID=A0A345DMM2_9MOLU|nr:hypothetical protein [Spiroplasma phoeniceum]AXF95460.1 hypothetical protein SDAV_00466 [Spiroplasma phoeniceum P40]
MNSYKIIIGYYNKICSVCNKEIPIIFTQAGLIKISQNENKLLYYRHVKCIKNKYDKINL